MSKQKGSPFSKQSPLPFSPASPFLEKKKIRRHPFITTLEEFNLPLCKVGFKLYLYAHVVCGSISYSHTCRNLSAQNLFLLGSFYL